jgi:hypothetical protein
LQCRKKLRCASLFVLFIFLNVGFCLSKLDFEKCVIILYFLSEWVLFRRYGDVDKAYEFTSYLATLCFTNKIYADLSISCSLERHSLQEIDVPVEVRNPAGNFDTPGKIFVRGFWSTKSKI